MNSARVTARRRASPVGRTAVAVGLAVLASVQAVAFDPDIHEATTRAALARVAAALPTASDALRNRLLQQGFTPGALQEIADANKAMDSGDCGTQNIDDPAVPCTPEGVQALARLQQGLVPEPEHFDAEQIQEGSDFVFRTNAAIRRYLVQRRFVAARRELGQALHAIQDFYAHTNWVELGQRQPDSRLGAGPGSFESGKPRLAGPNEPTCVGGARLLTTLSDLEWIGFEDGNNSPSGQHGLITRYELAEAQGRPTGAITSSMLREAWTDPPLTSGYFFMWGVERRSPPLAWLANTLYARGDGESDTEDITVKGKCRHGYRRAGVYQPGIAKDNAGRGVEFENASALAEVHSANFIVGILNHADLRNDANFLDLVLGLMGHGPPPLSLTVGVPRAPNGDTWDTAVGSALRLFTEGIAGLKNIQPDIRVCVQPASGSRACTAVCEDADWSTSVNAYLCTQPMPPVLLGPNLSVVVQDVDPNDVQIVAAFEIANPGSCQPWCTLDTPGGTLLISFGSAPVGAPQVAIPAGGSGPAPAVRPPGAGGANLPSSNVPTSVEIDATLGLRDADACAGPDRFFPQGTAFASSPVGRQLGPAAAQVYQLAAFATAIPDATAKQAVLREVQARVGDAVYLDVMTQVILDVQQSRGLAAAYQSASGDLAQRIFSTGLNFHLPLAPPASSIAPSVGGWIAGQLTRPGGAARAVDLIAGGSGLTAECTLNQLAREGFAAAIGAR